MATEKEVQPAQPTDPQNSTLPDVTMQPDGGSEFTEKDVNFTSFFMPFVRNYVSNLAHNKNPIRLPYPPCFYYPASSLQHQMHLQMHYVSMLTSANSLTTPLERFMNVLKYSISTCSLTKFPYKPIIAFMGETAQTFTSHNGDQSSTTYYVGEQVEREPATSAFYICDPTKGVVHEGSVAMVPKFKQAHIHVSFVGQRRTILAHPQGLWNETYVADVPDLMIRLLRMHTELGGSLSVSCVATGYAATIQFKDKPIFGGLKHGIVGRVTFQGREIYQLEGAWDSVVYLIDSITKERLEFFNRQTYPRQKAENFPLEQLPETSGEKVWGPLIETLLRHDFEQAKIIKADLDVKGHERLAQFEQNPYVPAFFHKNPATGNWDINDPALIYGPSPSGNQAMGLPSM